MTATSFEPQSFLRFDLSSGRLSAQGDDRHFVVPASLLEAAGSSSSLATAARQWGEQQGKFLASFSPGDAHEESPEEFLSNLTALMAALGWGRPNLESWGGVLFAVVEDAPSGAGSEILAAFLGGVFGAVGKEPFGCVDVGDGRYLLTDTVGAEAVRAWIQKGAGLGEIVSRMQKGEHIGAGGS